MLLLARKPGERIMIGDDIIIEVLGIDSRGQVRLGITAPQETPIFREEILKRIKANGESEVMTANYPKVKRS